MTTRKERRSYDIAPKEGERFSQEEVRALFNQIPERAERGNKIIFTDGAGRENGLRFNLIATLAIEDRYVYGNALICDRNEAPL